MGNDFYDGIMQGLSEALAITKGEAGPAHVHRMTIINVKDFTPDQIKQIRRASKMTQELFAACIGVSKKSVEAWEGGRSKPDGAARRTIGLLQADPLFFDKMEVIVR